MFSRIGTIWKNYHPVIVVGGIVFFSHLGWKHLQDIGVGDPGRDYPIKNLPKIAREVTSGKQSDEDHQSVETKK